jgi:hypothetical protein
MICLSLTHADLYIHPDRREVDTVFRDGKVQGAQRSFSAEDTAVAAELGYEASAEGVFSSLVCHELMHSLVSEWLWNRPSEVLRHYCAAEPCPYYRRIYVEAIVLAWERLLQTDEMSEALYDIEERYGGRFWGWHRHARELLRQAAG